jgi:hypothetical protein
MFLPCKGSEYNESKNFWLEIVGVQKEGRDGLQRGADEDRVEGGHPASHQFPVLQHQNLKQVKTLFDNYFSHLWAFRVLPMCKVKFSLLVSASHKFPLWKYLKQVKNVFGKQFVNQFHSIGCV